MPDAAIGELDLHLWAQGRHERLWELLGAHETEREGVAGTLFTVWAPRAAEVRLLGDFNWWQGQQHPLTPLGGGIWGRFEPGVRAGALYKFELRTASGHWVQRADPMARRTEHPPATASVVHRSDYEWGDADWMSWRASVNPHLGPLSVYELHLGSWRPGLGYREAAAELVEYVTQLGFTHVEFLPLAEHPYGPSWGYQVTGYYAPTARFGSPDELKHLIDALHRAGIGVILDWVPGHFPKDEWALARFDGQPLYEYEDPRLGEHPDWGTLVFDYANPQVRNFLVANALYWLEEFHVDGLRVDAVASMLYLDYSREEGQWLPNAHGGRENLEAIAFLQEVTATAYRAHPGVLVIAEESTAWPGVTAPTETGGLGFGLKWNMGWMHDTLHYLAEDPVNRAHHRAGLDFTFHYAFSERFLLPISHDEVVHGKGSLLHKMPGDHWQQFANARLLLAYQWAYPGKQLLFMGCEFGQPSEWSEARGLDWWALDHPAHRGLQALVSALNQRYRATPALWALDHEPAGLQQLGTDGGPDALAFARRDAAGSALVAAFNFGGNPLECTIGLPAAGDWDEVLNTDAAEFGGSGVGNLGRVRALAEPFGDAPASARLTLPPLGALWLQAAG